MAEKVNFGLTYCDMYKNKYENFTKGENPNAIAYDEIFVNGNSQESILEIQFSETDSRSNPVVGKLWGYNTGNRLAVSSAAIEAVYSGAPVTSYTDSRTWFSAWDKTSNTTGLPGTYCFKWNQAKFIANQDSKKAQDITLTVGSSTYSNWIIYRMSDMMLIKAEALAMLGETKEAMRYVNAIHRRWYCSDNEKDPKQPTEDVTDAQGALNDIVLSNANTIGNAPKAASVEIAVMNERLLEFIGEGKRWFDLVRYAERHAGGVNGTKDEREWSEENPVNSGKVGVDLMIDNFMKITYSNVSESLKTRFKNRYGLYNLIHYMEIKASVDANGVQHLEQNPVWNKSKYD